MSQLNVYNYEAKGFVVSPEEFESALELDMFALMINQLKPSVNISPTLFHSNVVVLEAKWFGNVNYQRLKETADSFSRRRIQFESKTKDAFVFSHPFPDVSYYKGKITIEINQKYMPYFLELSNGYSGYLLEELKSLKTFRTKKLFRILSLHKNLNTSTWNTNIEECMLLLKGENFGNRYAYFISKIIKPAIKEINKKTSLNVELDYNKKTRAMKFVCILDIQPPVKEPQTDKQKRAYLKLIGWGVAPSIANEISTQKTDEFWLWNHKVQEKIIDGIIKSPGAVVVKHFGYLKKRAKESPSPSES